MPGAPVGSGATHPEEEYDAEVRIEGRGPPLVYVPGMDGTGQLFYTQVPALARHFSVTMYALRDTATEMDALVADLERVVRIAASNGEPAVLVAESFGGALAMSFALAHPAMVRGLVVLNSFPYYGRQFRLRLALGMLRIMPWGMMRTVRWLTASRLHSHHTRRAEIRRFLQPPGSACPRCSSRLIRITSSHRSCKPGS